MPPSEEYKWGCCGPRAWPLWSLGCWWLRLALRPLDSPAWCPNLWPQHRLLERGTDVRLCRALRSQTCQCGAGFLPRRLRDRHHSVPRTGMRGTFEGAQGQDLRSLNDADYGESWVTPLTGTFVAVPKSPPGPGPYRPASVNPTITLGPRIAVSHMGHPAWFSVPRPPKQLLPCSHQQPAQV